MNRLWIRLSLTFSAVILVGVLVIVVSGTVFVQSGVLQSLVINELISPGGAVEQLRDYYLEHNGWDGIQTLFLSRSPVMYFGPDNLWTFNLMDTEGNLIVGTELQPQTGRVTDSFLPITINDDQIIGYLVVRRYNPEVATTQATNIFQRAIWALLVITVISGVLGAVGGTLMSRSLTAPLSRLAEAAKAIGARDLKRRVKVEGSQEIVELAIAFNDMAQGLEQAETLRRNMVADIAHELRTPLSVLKGNLTALMDDVYPLTKAEVSRLYDQTHLLSRLVNDLHELSQAEARQLPLNWQDVDLAQLVLEQSAAFSPLLEERGVQLKLDVPTTLKKIHADPARIAQILGNLLMNANAHTPANGTITVRVISGTDAVMLSVADTGEGIPAEHLSHVFDRFYRTDRSRARSTGGAGLGLAIVRALTELHGGGVTVASEGIPGRGSVFTVRLPLVQPHGI
ncbi:MAG: ATP-binding protein [Anaerolineae bacterium]